MGDMLPDHVLVMVFRCLDNASLLSARGVCRRWRDLALSRAVWRHRSLLVWSVAAEASDDDRARYMVRQGAHCLQRALRLAPCLFQLHLNQGTVGLLPLRHVRCAVGQVHVWSLHVKDMARTMAALQGLLSAGCQDLFLRNLLEADLPALRLFLRAIRDADLTTLDLGFSRGYRPVGSAEPLVIRGSNRATLQTLRYSFEGRAPTAPGRELWPSSLLALENLLVNHSATLTCLHLQDVGPYFPVALLTGCPNLRELKCPPLLGLAALLQCRGLECLRLVVERGPLERPAVLQSARDFFSGATNLRSLELVFGPSNDGSADVSLSLLTALGRAQPRLETLSVVNLCNAFDLPTRVVDYRRLGALLPAFPRLTTVGLRGLGRACRCWPDLERFLAAVSPATAPRLRLLELDGLALCPGDAGCDWPMFPDPEDSTGRYVADLRAVLRSNPKLHVAGPRVCDECRQNGCFRKLQCASCWVDGCQVPVRRRDYPGSSVGLFGLYSHDSDEPCDLHTGRRVWAKLEEPHEDGQL